MDPQERRQGHLPPDRLHQGPDPVRPVQGRWPEPHPDRGHRLLRREHLLPVSEQHRCGRLLRHPGLQDADGQDPERHSVHQQPRTRHQRQYHGQGSRNDPAAGVSLLHRSPLRPGRV